RHHLARMRASAQEGEVGGDSKLGIGGHAPCSSRKPRRRVGKGVGTAAPQIEVSRTPCPRVLVASTCDAWARRTRGFTVQKGIAFAFAHPTTELLVVHANSPCTNQRGALVSRS